MYKLYYSPGACSMAIHVALNECNQEVELKKIDLQAGEGQTPEYLKINSRGQVPVLADGELHLREGAAILMYIFDKHDSALLPQSGTARAKAIEWMMFANSTMHPAYGRAFWLKKNKVEGALVQTAVDNINKLWADVEKQLAKQPYVCGDEITIGDILLTVIANWSGNVGGTVNFGPSVKKLLKSVSSRPAYQKALGTEQVEYKAAA